MLKDITVILPIAGKGKRFWPFSNKHFLPFLSKPLIYYPLSQLERHGFSRLVLVVRKGNKKLAEEAATSFSRLSIKVVVQEKGDGLGDAILAARKYLKGKVVLLSPHDIVEDSLFAELVKKIRQKPQALVVGKRMKQYFPGGYLVIRDGLVEEIIEKPKPSQRPGDTVALVCYFFSQGEKLVEAVRKTPVGWDDQFERAVSFLLKQGLPLKLLRYQGYWGFLKYPWNVLDVMEFFLTKIKRGSTYQAKVDRTVTITGPVEMEEGVIVYPHATIVGPSFIGAGTVVGNNALVRQAHIGRGCVVGFSSEVARSYVSDNCWFHSNYVGDSVVGKDVAMGAGGVIANLRLDEREVYSTVGKKKVATGRTKLGAMIGDQVRIGVNTSVMPGVKIGPNSCIGPGLTVEKDVPAGKRFFFVNNKYCLIDNQVDIAGLNRSEFVAKLK